MSKEILSIENIKKDLRIVANSKLSNKLEWRLAYAMTFSILSVFVGVVTNSILAGLLLFSVATYHIVRYIISYKEYRIQKKAIEELMEKGDISISLETFSHVAEEIIYEPWVSPRRRRVHMPKFIRVYNFMSGTSWRVPEIDMHYKWSKTHYISLQGLENISVQGNEFIYVSLQGYYDISYIYPLKLFELDKTLKK